MAHGVKKLNRLESALKILQVGVNVTCMHTNFGEHGLSGFGDIAPFEKRPISLSDHVLLFLVGFYYNIWLLYLYRHLLLFLGSPIIACILLLFLVHVAIFIRSMMSEMNDIIVSKEKEEEEEEEALSLLSLVGCSFGVSLIIILLSSLPLFLLSPSPPSLCPSFSFSSSYFSLWKSLMKT